MGFPDPQFGTPLSIEDIPNELPFNTIYGVTPSNQYIPIRIDSQGRLDTTATLTGSVTIGQIGDPDKSSYFYGASLQQTMGGVYQDTNPTLLPGQEGAVRLTEYRAFHVNLRDSLGQEITSNSGSLDVNITNTIPIEVEIDHNTNSIAIWGTDGTTQRFIKTDVNGNLNTNVLSSALPANAAKETGGHLASVDAGVETLNSLVPSVYDYIDLQYSGANLTKAKFYFGGPSGTLVSTLDLVYTGANLTSVQRS